MVGEQVPGTGDEEQVRLKWTDNGNGNNDGSGREKPKERA